MEHSGDFIAFIVASIASFLVSMMFWAERIMYGLVFCSQS